MIWIYTVAGWDEGCLTMRQGEVSRLTVAGHKGYGPQGFPAWGYPLLHSLVVIVVCVYSAFFCNFTTLLNPLTGVLYI